MQTLAPIAHVAAGIHIGSCDAAPRDSFAAVLSLEDGHTGTDWWHPTRGTPHLILPMRDTDWVDASAVRLAVLTLRHWHQTVGTKILVRCQSGINRSALVIGAWLVAEGARPETALYYLRAARPGVLDNGYFDLWLREAAPAVQWR